MVSIPLKHISQLGLFFPIYVKVKNVPNDVWLVVLTILKNMKVNGKDCPIYYGKQKMFQTTNQMWNIFCLGSDRQMVEYPHQY